MVDRTLCYTYQNAYNLDTKLEECFKILLKIGRWHSSFSFLNKVVTNCQDCMKQHLCFSCAICSCDALHWLWLWSLFDEKILLTVFQRSVLPNVAFYLLFSKSIECGLVSVDIAYEFFTVTVTDGLNSALSFLNQHCLL